MVPLQRLAVLALAFLVLFGSCDRVSTPQESEEPIQLDLTYGVWSDSTEAARDSLRQDRPFLGTITVGDTLWVRVRTEGDIAMIRSVDAFFAGSWKSVPVPVFFPVSWNDSGLQKVKVGIFTEDDQFFDSMSVLVTNLTPVVRLPDLPGDGSLRVRPDSASSIFVESQDDGRIDSLRWDLDGDGVLDTATLPRDTLHLRWSLERILRARTHPVLKVVARDEDGNVATDSFALSLEVPPPSLSLAGPDTVSIGDTLRFAATATGFAPLQPVRWQDDSVGADWIRTAPNQDTILVVRAIVRDSMGSADTAERRVVVLRDAPEIVGQDTIRVHAGRSVRLSAGATQRFGSIVAWGWDLDGDSVFGRGDTTAGIDTVFETVGLRRVGLAATDDDGNVGSGTLLVLVTDSVPTISLTGLRDLGLGDTATIGATAADPDGDSLVLRIVVDGDTLVGATRQVRFDSAGPHVVRAIVRAYTPRGTLLAEVSVSDTILVLQGAPNLDLGPDSTIAWGGTWRASLAKATDSTGSVATTEWDWNGDGTWDTTLTGWSAPAHRFLGDTGRVVVRARVTDDDGNRAVDSLALRLDPAPWNVVFAAPSGSPRLSDIVVKLSWTDSVTAGSTVRWTTNEGLDTTRSPAGDIDSIVVLGRMVDTLRVTATLLSPSGAATTRSVAIVLDALLEGPEIFLSGPDTVSWGDTVQLAAEILGDADPSAVTWWNQTTGLVATALAPTRDTVLQLKARIQDDLGRADSAIHTVVVVRDAPAADAGPDVVAHAGRSIRLSGSATQRFGGIVEWAWDLDGDGIFSTSGTSAGIDTTWESTSSRTVVLRVRDDDGNVDLDTLVVSVTDSVHTLAISATTPIAMNDTATLSATVFDPDGDSIEVLWVVDGYTTTGATRRVAFDSVGIHVVQAIANSYTPAGTLLATRTLTDTLLVVSDPPKLELGPDGTIAWGGTWRALGATATDSTGTIATTEWDWDGNGTWDTTAMGWAAPAHRFLADTGRLVVRARVTDDDGNRVVDSLALRVDPSPWNVVLAAPGTAPRRSDIVVRLSWTDSVMAGSSIRWTSNEGLDTTTSAAFDSDSLRVQGILADSLHVTAQILSPSGARTTRRTSISLGTLGAPPTISLSGPDTLSWGDTLMLSAQISGSVTPSSVIWWNQLSGLSAQLITPTHDSVMTLKARITDSLGRVDSATKTVFVVRDAPVANAGSDRSFHAGILARLSGGATQRFGDIVSWGWDLDGDGVFSTSTTTAGKDTIWETVGTRTVVFMAQDDDGNVDLDTLLVTITDAAPTLSLNIPTTVASPNTALLIANAVDPDGDSLEVFWVVDGDTLQGASQGVVFTSGGTHTVAATVRTYTRSAGTFLAQTTKTGTVDVTSDIMVELLSPDTVWTETSGNGTLLQTQITAPAGLQSIEWSLDNGVQWTTGSLTGTLNWFAQTVGTNVVIVRVVDNFGATNADTATIEHSTDRPVIDMPDSVTVSSQSRSSTIPLDASIRFGDISSVRWRWTDADGPHAVDQNPSPGTTVSSPLVQSFPPGRFVVTVDVIDTQGDLTRDSVVVSSVGIRVALSTAPESVAVRANLHAEGTFEVWPTDSAVETGFTFDGAEFVGTPSIDVRPPEPGSLPLVFWANFLGSQSRTTDERIVEVVDDPPVIQTFADETIGEGTIKDLSFTATRKLGGISTWIWDLSAVVNPLSVPQGIATDWNPDGGTLAPLPIQILGNRRVGYGVVDEAGDTTWAYRNILVVGAPVAVDDVLGIPARNGIDVACEVGTDCKILPNFLLDNDQIGFGLQGVPTLVEALDGARLQVDLDGTSAILPAPSTAGDHTFRYVISNGYLQDTGMVQIRIYARTEPAGFDTKTYPIEKAYVETDAVRSWTPPFTQWQLVFPLPRDGITEYGAFYVEIPQQVGGGALVTGNVVDTLAPPGADLYFIDPALGFRLDYDPSSWMTQEEETHDFKVRVATTRNDNAGIPGQYTWRDYTLPITFQRLVKTKVEPTPEMDKFNGSYNCDGSASFDYLLDVDAVQNQHDGDQIKIALPDLTFANDGKGFADGDIVGTLTGSDGKPIDIPFKRDASNWISGFLPPTGGVLNLHFELKGLLDGQGKPRGALSQSWLPTGLNAKSTFTQNSTGGTFPIANACR